MTNPIVRLTIKHPNRVASPGDAGVLTALGDTI